MGRRERSRCLVAGLLGFATLALLFFAAAAIAAPPLRGTLDRSFGSDGTAVPNLEGGLADMAIDRKGRIVTAGYTSHGDFLLARFHSDGSLDDAYDAYEQAVEDAGYDVLFKEKEEEDAEISYKGEGTTGQIALRAVCGEDDKLVVHITNRPA